MEAPRSSRAGTSSRWRAMTRRSPSPTLGTSRATVPSLVTEPASGPNSSPHIIQVAMVGRDGSTQANKAIVTELFERVFNQRDLDFADEIVSPDVIDHNPPPGSSGGVEGLKERVRLDAAAFADYRMSVEAMIAAGDP